MSDFIEVTLPDGSQVLFEATESDLVTNHGGSPDIEETKATIDRIRSIALATGQMCKSFQETLTPDALTMEIGVGLSGEVGWFFAKSQAQASMKVTISWTPKETK